MIRKITEPSPWEVNPEDAYAAIAYQQTVVGFCKPEVAKQIIATLNENETLYKAFRLVCADLAARIGGLTTAEGLMQQYLARAERPKQGTGAIALLLQERQEELDLTDEEFAKFCDTFRLSPAELNNIYQGEDLDSAQLTPLSRILGMTVDELIEVWKGSTRG